MRYCIGYGSLVCKESARKSVPDLKNFQLCHLSGYKRIFGKVNPQTLLRQNFNPQSERNSSILIKESNMKQPLVVSCFQVPDESWLVLQQRECDYYEREVVVITIDGLQEIRGTVFVGYENDEQMIADKQQSLEDIYGHWPQMRHLYNGSIYRKDILPADHYLDICLKAFKKYGDTVLQNFLETTFLADEKTTIFEYLKFSKNS